MGRHSEREGMGQVKRGIQHTTRAAAVLTAACAIALSTPSPAQTAPQPLTARAHSGVLRIATPDQAVSEAVRDNADLVSKAGRVPEPTPGYTVHARVIVRTNADIASLVGQRSNLTAAPHPGVRGFVVIDCPTVREAIALRDALARDTRVDSAQLDITPPRALRSVNDTPTDPATPAQWYLDNTRHPSVDLNVVPVWASGITGTGVTVGVVEGGWQTDHPDIAPNYDTAASMPMGSATSHSTSCAGIVAAAANNGLGGTGVAHGARVSKLVYGNSADTAEALTFRPDLNHIMSNSWGPPDQGILADIPDIERAALEQGATTGRGGLGTVYTWASGNGGLEDRVDYDPYASSRHTIAIGAIGDLDTRADYNEPGSSVFVVAPSSGNVRRVFTTANDSGYNPGFGGTSAACPMGAGVVALMLQANPALSTRDVQHVLARTSRRCDPTHPDWTPNGAGLWVNHHYGFGALDAHAAVTLAHTWTPVGPAMSSDTGTVAINTAVPDNTPSGLTRTLTIPDALDAEHVELILDATTTYVGDLRITLTSPSGTVSVLAEQRDDPQDDLDERVFTTVRHWGEAALGNWTVQVADRGPLDYAVWNSARLIVHGTPSGPTPCSPADLADPIGVLNFFDLARYIALFNAGDTAADLDSNGVWNFFDLVVYIQSYNVGCP